MTVVADHHAAEMSWQIIGNPRGEVIHQPKNCSTVAGIFLPLTYIRHRDPQATVIVYPSDHFVFSEYQFVQIAGKLIRAAGLFSERLMLLGISLTGTDLDYGWIEPT